MGNEAIGKRVAGIGPARQERWYECAVMGEPVPESRTIIPRWPARFAGMRVCVEHTDPLSNPELEMITPPKVSDEEWGP